MQKFDVYKIKKGINLKKFRTKYEWDNLPANIANGDLIVFKIVQVELESTPAQLVIELLENEEFLRATELSGYKLSDKFEFEDEHDENGNVKKVLKLNDFAIGFATTWRIEAKLGKGGDRILCFTAGDMTFPYSYAAKKIIDEYCHDIIETLKNDDIIEMSTYEK